MIEQKGIFVVTIKISKDYSYLPNGSGDSMICTSPQSLNIQIRLSVNIDIFEEQAIVLEFQLQTEK